MLWNVAICFVWLCLACTIIVTVISSGKKRTGINKPINVIFSGIIVAGIFGIFPTNYVADGLSGNGIAKFIEALSLTLVNVMQMFTVDLGGKDLLDAINEQDAFFFQRSYVFTMSILCTIAPLLTVGVLASVLMSLSARWRYLFSFFKPAYIFSDLNERSITLASNIKKNHLNSVIVFTDVVDREEEAFLDLSNRAKHLGAIMFKQDILSQKFYLHRDGAEITFFIIGDNETENINHTLSIIAKYKERKNTRLYLFSSTKASELALSKIDKGNVKIHRVNEVRSLIYRTLYEKGNILFDKAINYNGVKHINAIVLGMGNYGTEMVKALAWLCQMDGYKLSIHGFDKDKKAETKFGALCPDLLSPQYNGITKDGESYYSIKIHSDFDVDTSDFIAFFQMLSEEERTTYIFISLGSDEENIRVAANMRMIFKRLGATPVIQTVVKSSNVSKALANAVDRKGKSYEIELIGDVDSSYTENVIINSELEQEGLTRHVDWCRKDWLKNHKNQPETDFDESSAVESFWNIEYNYLSTIASVIHRKARNNCGIDGTDILSNQGVDALTVHQREALQCLEHRRWNAYMRAEGYVYCAQRDDMAQMHPDLKSYHDLPENEREKDLW